MSLMEILAESKRKERLGKMEIARQALLKIPKKETSKEDEKEQKTQVSEPQRRNDLNISTSWGTLLEEANLYEPPDTHTIRKFLKTGNDKTLGNIVLDVSLEKSAQKIFHSTGWDKKIIKSELVLSLVSNSFYKSSVINAVRFFRDVKEDVFVECQECGETNTPPWEYCEKCHSPRK